MSGWGDQGGEEESSFISMTDMMVGLLLIFIILTTFFALQAHAVIDEAAAVSRVERAAVVARSILFQHVQRQLDDDRIQFDETTGTIRFSDDVLRFGTNSDVIPQSSFEVLRQLADTLAASLPCLTHVDVPPGLVAPSIDCDWLKDEFRSQFTTGNNQGQLVGNPGYAELANYRPSANGSDAPKIWIDAVFIEGHTDCVPFGRAEPDLGNWQLGASRASRTILFLLDHNPMLGWIFSKNPDEAAQATGAQRVLGVASYADRRPAHAIGRNTYPNDPRRNDDWRTECNIQGQDTLDRNRRIDIRIVMGWTALEAD
jgi:hypothetical protein